MTAAFRKFAWTVCLTAIGLSSAGCHPAKYRMQTDAEVRQLVAEKSHDPRWPLEDYSIDPDPRARFYDPADPDCPPMPPDDPASHRFMQWVDGKAGYKCWTADGTVPSVESPYWLEHLPRDEEGRLRLNLQQAVELSRLHSPDYQEELERLYLNALNVSVERFRFDTQFFAGYDVFFTADGPDRAAPGGDASSVLDLSTRGVQMRRLYASGGELVVGLANSLMWQFSGPNTYTANTVIDLSIVQPLLRGAGRDVVLESLTQRERDLLANVRDLERYYRGFYAEVAVGRPARDPGFSGAPGRAAGFYGLLQTQQEIRNQQTNVEGLRDSLEQLEAAFDAGRIDRFQVDLARQALYTAESQLLSSRNQYQTTLDRYKITLGLPPQLEMEIDDPLLDPFKLVDPQLTGILQDARRLAIARRGVAGRLSIENWRQARAEVEQIRRRIDAHYEVVEQDFAALEANLPARRTALRRLEAQLDISTLSPDDPAYSVAALDARVEELKRDFELLLIQRAAAQERFDALDGPDDYDQAIDWLFDANHRLMALQLIQARARLDTIVLTPVEVESETAVRIAGLNRRDWMNERAAVVDQWRQIRLAKNDLKSRLDVVFHGDISNVGDNPFNLQSSAGRLQVGLQFDAPLTRLIERNNYRRSLIAYQTARRNFYTFEDNVASGLRSIVRDLQFNQLNFELRRAAVFVAISQVDLAQLRLNEPPRPGVAATFRDTTARDLVNALAALLQAQNSFVNDWVTYQVLRLSLDLDLGTMQLDERGMWIDPGEIRLVDPEEALQEQFRHLPQAPLRSTPCCDRPPPLPDYFSR